VIPFEYLAWSELRAFEWSQHVPLESLPHTWAIYIDLPCSYSFQDGVAPVPWGMFARHFTTLVPSLIADVALVADLVTCVSLRLASDTSRCSLFIQPPNVTLHVGERHWSFDAPTDEAVAQFAPRMLEAIGGGTTTEHLTYRFYLPVDETSPPEQPRGEEHGEDTDDEHHTEVDDPHLAYEPDEVDAEDEVAHAEPDAFAGLSAAAGGDIAIVASDSQDDDDDDDDDSDGDGDPDRIDPARILDSPPAEVEPAPIERPIGTGRRGVFTTMPGLGVRPA
jgi:hypothetical protein